MSLFSLSHETAILLTFSELMLKSYYVFLHVNLSLLWEKKIYLRENELFNSCLSDLRCASKDNYLYSEETPNLRNFNTCEVNIFGQRSSDMT